MAVLCLGISLVSHLDCLKVGQQGGTYAKLCHSNSEEFIREKLIFHRTMFKLKD